MTDFKVDLEKIRKQKDKKYEWNKKLIEKQYKEALEKAKTDPLFEYDVFLLEALRNNDGVIFPKKRLFKDFVKDDIKCMSEYTDFHNDIVNFANYTSDLPREIELVDLDYNPGILFSEVHDFYNHLGGEWQKKFNKVFKERKDNFRRGDLRSYSVYLPGTKYAYISLGENYEVSSFIDLAHEYAHTIVDMTYYRDYEDSNYPFIELPSLFMELAFGDWISNSFDGMDDPVNEERLLSLKIMSFYADNIVNFTRYIVSIMEDGEDLPTTLKKAIDDAASKLEITKTKGRKMFAGSKKEEYAYLLPYLTALELYNIYLQDEKEALNILKKIIVMEPLESYNDYLKSLDINLNEHSEDYIQKVLKKYQQWT